MGHDGALTTRSSLIWKEIYTYFSLIWGITYDKIPLEIMLQVLEKKCMTSSQIDVI